MGMKEWFQFSNAEAIWNEIRTLWPAVNGISYERLENTGIQWPCPTINHPGTSILHKDAFPIEGNLAKLTTVDFIPTHEQADSEFPFILITGRELNHFNAGTMTYRTLQKTICPSDMLHLNPGDAKSLDLTEGEMARVVSRYGKTIIPVAIDSSLKTGEVFSTFSDNKIFINKITNPHQDSYVQTPEYKITAVRVEKITAENNEI
jgi:formate dehydrogenase major subunit